MQNKAKIDPNKKYKTRCGSKVKYIHINHALNHCYPVQALYLDNQGCVQIESYTEEGLCYPNEECS